MFTRPGIFCWLNPTLPWDVSPALRQTYRRSSALCPHRQLRYLESAARCETEIRHDTAHVISKIYGGFHSHGGTPIARCKWMVYDGKSMKIPSGNGWFRGTTTTMETPIFSGMDQAIQDLGHHRWLMLSLLFDISSMKAIFFQRGTQWLEPCAIVQ